MGHDQERFLSESWGVILQGNDLEGEPKLDIQKFECWRSLLACRLHVQLGIEIKMALEARWTFEGHDRTHGARTSHPDLYLGGVLAWCLLKFNAHVQPDRFVKSCQIQSDKQSDPF